MKNIILFFASLLILQTGSAQTGIPDTTFADHGKYTFFDIASDPLTYVLDAIIDNNGDIIVAGYTSSSLASSGGYLMKMNQAGVLDSGFGDNGILSFIGNPEIPGTIEGIAQNNDGNYLILSSKSEGSPATLTFYLNEISPNGQLTPGYGNGNNHFSVTINAFSVRMKISPQGKTWVTLNMINVPDTFTTSANIYATQFNSDGSLNTSFGNAGMFEFGQNQPDDRIFDMAFDSDDKAYLTGNQRLSTSFGALSTTLTLCVNSSGQLESSFGNNGVYTYNDNISNFGTNSIEVLENGEIVIAGFRYEPFVAQNSMLAKLNSQGQLMSGFGNQGVIVYSLSGDDEIKDLQVLTDGRIMAIGYVQNPGTDDDLFIGSFNSNGNPISSFGNSGFTVPWDLDGGEDKPRRILATSDGSAIFGVGDGYSQGINLSVGDYGFIVKYLNNAVTAVPDIKAFEPTVFPNPTSDQIVISNHEQITQLQLLDMQGRILMLKFGLVAPYLDLSSLNEGVYILKMQSRGNKIFNQKIVKTR